MRTITTVCTAILMICWGGAANASSAELIAKGEYLARAGDCVVCHTGPGERPFAGGLRMSTPLGDIFTTNITPDKETGIGTDSFDDFKRAMQLGIAKDGHRLYPAMPYPSYAKVSDDDLRALYAFFMDSVPPTSRKNSPTEIHRPLNIRWPLMIWDKIFTEKVGYVPEAAHDEVWNRGAYLVQGLGHCGSCHTPRGIFFQEKALTGQKPIYLSGGNLDNWFASSLREDPNAGLARWSEADVAQFLKTGHNSHATAFGTMIDAINNSTQYLSDEDLTAIATYLKSLPGNQTPSEGVETAGDVPSGKLYAQQCAACHVADGKGHAPYIAPLAGNPAVMDADPSSLINITLNGSSRVVVDGMPDAYRMPQFRVLLNDDEIAAIVSFIRTRWGNTAGPVTADQVTKIRKTTDAASDAVVVLKCGKRRDRLTATPVHKTIKDGKHALLKNCLSPALAAGALCAMLLPSTAFAWNDEGHKIIALIADHYLDPAVKQQVDAMLNADKDPLTKHDIASEATWADAHRDLDRQKGQDRFAATEAWHSVKLELDHPDIGAACGGRPTLPSPASQGPADCTLDKITQFAAELSSKATPAPERLLALKYLLNLVGDLHEPLYVSDNHNNGGDDVRVSGGGADPGTLRHYWDAEFIDYLGDDPKAIADDLADGIRQSKTFAKMSEGTPKDWTMEAFGLAKDHAYGKLPAKKPDGSYELPPDYVTDAIETVRLQLAHAGVRLAAVLNKALASKN